MTLATINDAVTTGAAFDEILIMLENLSDTTNMCALVMNIIISTDKMTCADVSICTYLHSFSRSGLDSDPDGCFVKKHVFK